MSRMPWLSPSDPAAIRAYLATHRPSPAAVRSWAGRVLANRAPRGPVPLAGTPEWGALDDHDPRKLHGALIAAVAYIDESTPAAISARLRREMELVDQAAAQRLRDSVSELHGSRGFGGWWHPDHATLVRLRATHPCEQCRTATVVHPQRVCERCTQPATPQTIRARATASWARHDHRDTRRDAA
ncbi:DUF2742 domain-containing protein [Actinokineospora terrae]|uniref:Uncharacterized protein n=1 Tax=Actinokineospora terrae TaxID=155974 RepID=A0A1H9VHC1_9PSEU|nr:DUF2742 domain-containing protein [Actinokineospora terrae]SES20617.1 Protein of unknown function [Actinokineospora terrae]